MDELCLVEYPGNGDGAEHPGHGRCGMDAQPFCVAAASSVGAAPMKDSHIQAMGANMTDMSPTMMMKMATMGPMDR